MKRKGNAGDSVTFNDRWRSGLRGTCRRLPRFEFVAMVDSAIIVSFSFLDGVEGTRCIHMVSEKNYYASLCYSDEYVHAPAPVGPVLL